MQEFDPDVVVTNLIPWDYDPTAYSELADVTLDRIACGDPEIRMLLEEAIGYCFFRHNELSKAFILTGSGSNGKSTYLDMVNTVLGTQNVSSLDIWELSERFSVVTMFNKLANIGDDISDEFLQGNAISQFKKVVSGNAVKAETKGQDAFFYKPYTKLLFSANEIPRMRNRGFDAIKRRLVIIPFNAKFSK
jgi:putative DNA primase/helicase